MLNEPQLERVFSKLERFLEMIEPHIFEKVDEIEDVSYCHVNEQYHSIPDLAYEKAVKGETKWSGEGTYCWFRTGYTVPENLAGRTLFIYPHIMGYEAMLYVDGIPFGTYSTKIVVTGHGNHFCDLLRSDAKAGDKIDIALEYYAGHYVPTCGTWGSPDLDAKKWMFDYNGIDICVKNYEVQDFYFDLQALTSLYKSLPAESFRKADIMNTLYDVYKLLDSRIEDVSFDVILESMRKASPLLKACLAKKNGDTAPSAALIGHSHMDTAWLWHVGETVKKCARTYSNQLALMEEYPEYKFVQSSALHSEFIREHYPELFAQLQKVVAEGKYEPNGGVWVECDCNITSGESMVRQFLWGQRFTRKYFNYTANCFWLPDTFGYSAAIPQIMKGCSVDYFLTTKISWNDTNKFPYDTFWWQGIDGTKVFTHFNTTHHYSDPENIIQRISGRDGIKQKTVTDSRLLTFGFGDGGGGPQFEMIEQARRVKDTDGCPKSDYSLVGDFMKKLEKDCKNPNTYRGELYLELHRGTLTNQHTIKRNNRKSEFALHDLEFATVEKAVKEGSAASEEAIAPLYKTLLKNQFHDILPGTCINRAHVESRAQTTALIADAKNMTAALLDSSEDNRISVTNTLSFDRSDVLFLDVPAGKIVDGGYAQQRYVDLDGNEKLLVSGVTIPAFSSVTLTLVDGEVPSSDKMNCVDGCIENDDISIILADNGTISSFFDKRTDRELVEGENFNTLMLGEDMPNYWDNWDVDADFQLFFKDVSDLVASEVVSAGEVAVIVRNKYQISDNSTVTQDMIVFAEGAEVRFDTAIDWNDNHLFLKAAFDSNVYDDFARHDIQFGTVKRPTTRNTSVEQAKFEVVNHKYTDISEPGYGVAVLNDCKYGISTDNCRLRLSLHKGGAHPDHLGDRDGIHRCVYSFLPHVGDFGAETVIRPSYMLNVPAVQSKGSADIKPLIRVDAPNVIIETIKPCEDAENAFIARMYEAQGSRTNAFISAFAGAKKVEITNMLEETIEELDGTTAIPVLFEPFKIITLKVTY